MLVTCHRQYIRIKKSFSLVAKYIYFFVKHLKEISLLMSSEDHWDDCHCPQGKKAATAMK
jgi:hypothetical protein